MTSPHCYRTSRRAEFRDTDAAGIVHFSRFFTWMEEAEHELLRLLGFSVMHYDAQGKISWPRVSATCDFRGSVQFEQQVELEFAIERIGEKSVAYRCEFFQQGKLVAEGKLIAVCCRLLPGEPPVSIAIPDFMRVPLSHFQEHGTPPPG